MNHEQKVPQASRAHTFPAFLDIQGKKIVLIGGGANAARKARRLLEASALVSTISEELSTEFKQLEGIQNVLHVPRSWSLDDFNNAALVVIATDDAQKNTLISEAAHASGCWVNVANQPNASNFLIPSLIDRSPLLVAVSSGGSSPVLARLLTARINAFLPHTYADLGILAENYRERIRTHFTDWRQRRKFWERLLSGRIGELILQGRLSCADQAMEKLLLAHDTETQEGEVYLVGAGPGDPDLLTFRALRLMQQCDVVLYDRLVSEPIMALVNPTAERIYVGKRRSDHAVPQESINEQLVSHAKQGRRVLRLKGGDPFMFGRGGEEIETLASEGVSFQVVPGITAAAGCASYAGIPLTHRDYAQSCLFVTGHLKDGSVNLDWPALARTQQTVVIYMGLLGLPTICEQLIQHGLPSAHPIALVAEGTRHSQQVITGTLETLPEKIESLEIKPPTLIIVGEVVQLREKLAWFETRT
jgi:uroporphyrin-III C-methyltransferase/precorrin-2 dehydrogenase/sirohydrochlorin ferrochelatase